MARYAVHIHRTASLIQRATIYDIEAPSSDQAEERALAVAVLKPEQVAWMNCAISEDMGEPRVGFAVKERP